MTTNGEMEWRKWEDLKLICLANIFRRVGVESLTVDVPFVCKSWNEASRNPFCWKILHFPEEPEEFVYRFKRRFGSGQDCFKESKFIKRIIDRSEGLATTVDLGSYENVKEEVINYVAEKCPAVKKLVLLVWDEGSSRDYVPLAIGRFRNLVSLQITSPILFKDIVTQIGSNCENFESLKWIGDSYLPDIEVEDAMTLVTSLPRLKYLRFSLVDIGRGNLITIVRGCVDLVFLDIRDCSYAEEDDDLSEIAYRIATFVNNGSCYDDSYQSQDSDYSN